MYQRGLNVDIQKQNMNICVLIKYFYMLFTYGYKYRKSLNSDGQQNDQPPLFSYHWAKKKEITTFAGGNPGTDLGQEQQYSGFKAVNGIQTLSLSIIGYSTAIYM